MIGRILAGRYKVVAAIGEGGMSRVWRAQDLNTGKSVAVKVLREEFRDDETFVRRFEREAQAASRMTHPNIANLLDVGLEEDGTRYLVIEYVSGKTLKQFIQESGAIRPETAAQIIIRVLAALQHAHQNGVVHRDIKPQNILIDKEGTVKVSDFGIARVANSQTMSQDTETVMGSVYYFSPEQAKGAVTDEKSDIYSVGIVLYEMLTGRVPFTGDTPVAIAMKHLQEEPVTPSEINSAVSPALDYVVLHAMEKRPRHRYASASEMLQDVRLALDHPDTIMAARAEAERREREARAHVRQQEQRTKRTRLMRRILMASFALILLCVTALAGYLIMERILLSRRDNVEVPAVIGKLQLDAVNELAALGLEPSVSIQVYDLVSDGIVYEQAVAPGTIAKKGDIINIFVAKSAYTIRIPNVMNIPIESALLALNKLDLNVEHEYVADPATVGLVINQSLAPNSAANEGDTIILTVSGGQITMPDFSEMTQEQAETAITARGLVLKNIEMTKVNDPALIGKVVAQTPPAYRSVMRNSEVVLEIGAADETLYRANIMLELEEITLGTTVSITTDEDGQEVNQYLRTFDERTQTVSIQLFSRDPGEGIFRVYYDDELAFTGTAEFTR